jgi:hypothetical protein
MQGPSKVSVTWEDQQNINKFSNLYSRLGDVEEQLKEQKVRYSSRLDVTWSQQPCSRRFNLVPARCIL